MKKNNQPLISIIVPIYNVQNYVVKCIESILAQTYANLEIILIDDGSTDECGSIIDFYASKDARIKAVHQTNEGLSAARNKGLNIMRGDFIGFVDGDDWIAKNMYMSLYSDLISCSADIAVCGIDNVDINGKIRCHTEDKEANSFESSLIFDNTHDIIKYFIIDEKNNCVYNKLYSKHLYDGVHFPLNKIYEDCFTTYRVMDQSRKLIYSSEKYYKYVFRPESISHLAFSSKVFDIVEAMIEQYKYISDKYPDLEKKSKSNMLNTFLWSIQKAFDTGNIIVYEKEIEHLSGKMKIYSIKDCELLPENEKILQLLFSNFKQYITAVKIGKNRRNKEG